MSGIFERVVLITWFHAMNIRKAAIRDLPTLVPFARITFSEAFGHSFSPTDLKAHLENNLSARNFERFILNDVVLLAEDQTKLTGYIQFGLNGQTAEPVGVIIRIYVGAEYQSRGVGRALMDAALAHPLLKNGRRIVLDVWEHNPRAIKFYKRYGFRITGTREFAVA